MKRVAISWNKYETIRHWTGPSKQTCSANLPASLDIRWQGGPWSHVEGSLPWFQMPWKPCHINLLPKCRSKPSSFLKSKCRSSKDDRSLPICKSEPEFYSSEDEKKKKNPKYQVLLFYDLLLLNIHISWPFQGIAWNWKHAGNKSCFSGLNEAVSLLWVRSGFHSLICPENQAARTRQGLWF